MFLSSSRVLFRGGRRLLLQRPFLRPMSNLPSLDSVSDNRVVELVKRMKEHCPRALQELEKHQSKQGHWVWWVFPTQKEGNAEPPPRTAVTPSTAPLLVLHAPQEWRMVLEKVLDLAESTPGGINSVLPYIDHDRVRYFALFWKHVESTEYVDTKWIRDLAVRYEAQVGPVSVGMMNSFFD